MRLKYEQYEKVYPRSIHILNDIIRKCQGTISYTKQHYTLLSTYQQQIYYDFWIDVQSFAPMSISIDFGDWINKPVYGNSELYIELELDLTVLSFPIRFFTYNIEVGDVMAVYFGGKSGCQVWLGKVLRTLRNKIKLQYFNFNQEIEGSYEFKLDGDQTWFTCHKIICNVEGSWTIPEIFVIDYLMRKRIKDNIGLYNNLSNPDCGTI